MDTTFKFKEAAITPKRGEVKPIHIFSRGRRGIDDDTVADLVKALTRDGRFLHPIVVRAEGATHTASSPAATGSRHGSAASASSGPSRPTSIPWTRPTR